MQERQQTKTARVFDGPWRILLCVNLLSSLGLAGLLAAALLGHKLIRPGFYLLLLLLAVGGWGIAALRRYWVRTQKPGVVLLGVLLAFVMMVVLFAGVFLCSMAHSRHQVHTSPGGRHRLVVIEGGYIDAVFYAYPGEGPFYRDADNGCLSYRDLWSSGEGARILVEWESEHRAVVRILHEGFVPHEGSNPEDEIVVEFGAGAVQ